MDEPERLWTVAETAAFLGIPVTTLYQWRYRGYGPRGRRVGRYVRYDPRDVRSWFAAQDDGAASGVPQLLSWESARKRPLSWANVLAPGDGSCH